MIPIPISYINKILNAEIAPIGIAKQCHADENGVRNFV